VPALVVSALRVDVHRGTFLKRVNQPAFAEDDLGASTSETLLQMLSRGTKTKRARSHQFNSNQIDDGAEAKEIT